MSYLWKESTNYNKIFLESSRIFDFSARADAPEFLGNGLNTGALSRFTHLETFSVNFSRCSFAILNGLLLSLWCFSIMNCYFQVSCNLKVV